MTRPAVGAPGYTLLTAAAVCRLADNTAPVGIVLLVIARTGDARLAGLLVAAFTVPTLIAGPVLGAYLDRLRRKRLLFTAAQLVLALDLTAVLTLTGHVSGWLLAALAVAAGTTSPVTTSGYSSLVPLVVPPGALGRANALDSASYGLAGIAGPAVLSALAGAFGVTAGFAALVGVAAVGVPLLLTAPMPAAPMPGALPGAEAVSARVSTQAEESLRAAIADGLRLLRRSRELLGVTVATTAGMFFQGPMPVLLPLLAVDLGKPPSGGGWLLTAFSAGGLLGALASDRLIARWNTRPVLIGSLAGLAAFLALLAVTPSFWACLAVAAAAGVADGPSLAATFTVRQVSVPPDRYAQVLATAASLKIAAFSAGSAVAGLLTGAATIRELLIGLAIGQLLSASPLLATPRRSHNQDQGQDQGHPERGHVSPQTDHCSLPRPHRRRRGLCNALPHQPPGLNPNHTERQRGLRAAYYSNHRVLTATTAKGSAVFALPATATTGIGGNHSAGVAGCATPSYTSHSALTSTTAKGSAVFALPITATTDL
jgi:MFS family permease